MTPPAAAPATTHGHHPDAVAPGPTSLRTSGWRTLSSARKAASKARAQRA